jgi:hypothetical protein
MPRDSCLVFIHHIIKEAGGTGAWNDNNFQISRICIFYVAERATQPKEKCAEAENCFIGNLKAIFYVYRHILLGGCGARACSDNNSLVGRFNEQIAGALDSQVR